MVDAEGYDSVVELRLMKLQAQGADVEAAG